MRSISILEKQPHGFSVPATMTIQPSACSPLKVMFPRKATVPFEGDISSGDDCIPSNAKPDCHKQSQDPLERVLALLVAFQQFVWLP